MLYYETNERGSKKIGLLAGSVYVAVWVVMMFVVSFGFNERHTGEGILIDFGDTDSAYGLSDPAVNDSGTDDTDASTPADQDEFITQDIEDAPQVVVAETPARDRNPDSSTDNQQSVQQNQRTVDQRALFPGRTDGSTSTSEGNRTGSGNQGATDGNPQGSHDGSGAGAGAGGAGFDLAGRSVLGTLPQPSYGANKAGRVIIEITVDAAGMVVNATYRARGSTTNDSELVNAAVRAALQSRFSTIEGDGLQTGTITYVYQLK